MSHRIYICKNMFWSFCRFMTGREKKKEETQQHNFLGLIKMDLILLKCKISDISYDKKLMIDFLKGKH